MIPRGGGVDLIMYKTCSTLFESFTKGSEFGGFFSNLYTYKSDLKPPPPTQGNLQLPQKCYTTPTRVTPS